MKTLYEIKLRKARIDAEREANGLQPAYAAYEKEQPEPKRRTTVHSRFQACCEDGCGCIGHYQFTVDALAACEDHGCPHTCVYDIMRGKIVASPNISRATTVQSCPV